MWFLKVLKKLWPKREEPKRIGIFEYLQPQEYCKHQVNMPAGATIQDIVKAAGIKMELEHKRDTRFEFYPETNKILKVIKTWKGKDEERNIERHLILIEKENES